MCIFKQLRAKAYKAAKLDDDTLKKQRELKAREHEQLYREFQKLNPEEKQCAFDSITSNPFYKHLSEKERIIAWMSSRLSWRGERCN